MTLASRLPTVEAKLLASFTPLFSNPPKSVMLLDPLQARELFVHALKNKYAILAANADSPSAIGDCLEAAAQCGAPIIIETSLWQLQGASFGRGDAVLGLACYLANLAVLASSDRFSEIPVVFHTDHIKGPELKRILSAAIRGVAVKCTRGEGEVSASTISVDASELSPEENIEVLTWLAECAHKANVSATFEMEDAVDDDYTTIETANHLVGSVESRFPGSICLWAPALGTHHGLTQGARTFDPDLAVKHVENLKKLTGRDIGLALHGTSGLDEQALLNGVRAGVVKINWSSELLHLRATAGLEYFRGKVAAAEPGKGDWKNTVMDNGSQTHIGQVCIPVIKKRIELLGGEGRAPDFMKELRSNHLS
jgi:fructose-bisphosphate aldolase class II